MGTYENFDEQKQFACRVIADHARTTAFAIADGILPGNEGRNYVLRKIMRRAIYHGREHLGFDGLFFNKVCNFVVEQMKDAYPELETQREFIGKMVRLEEERFGNTLTVGLPKLPSEISNSIRKSIESITKLPNLQESLKKSLEPLTKANLELQESLKKSLEPLTKVNLGFQESLKKSLEPLTKVNLGFQESLRKSLEPFRLSDLQIDLRKSLEPLNNLPELSVSNEQKERIELLKAELESIYKQIGDVKSITENGAIPESLYLDLAKLYDTYGIPQDLIRVGVEERGFIVKEDEFLRNFDKALQKIQQQSDVGKTQQNEKINPIYKSLEDEAIRSNFHGYVLTKVEDAKVIAIVKNDEKVDELSEGDEGLIILDETPFYAESGGQVGDRGNIFNQNAQIAVHDTFAPIAGIVLHKSNVKSGKIKVGDTVTATVDEEKRDATRRNHTATHLVHAALKEVLGTHVKQGGSVVAPNYLRFDFTHYQPLSDAELKEVEDLVNRYILENHPVNTNEMEIEEAMRSGAVALFGEKYGSKVRVLSVGGGEFSKELCGGTHVRATGDIGSFKITNDEAIASGVRRIRAITGFDAFERFREDEILIDRSLQSLKTQRDQLPMAIEKLQEELKRTRKEVDDLKMKIATGAIGNVSSNGDEAKEISGVKVITKIVEGLDKGGMRHLSDTLLAKMKSGVVVLGKTEDEKVSFIVRVSDDLTGKVKAGKIVQEIAPIVGGRGGGKPDMAEGGGSKPEKLSEAIDASFAVIEKMLN